MKTVYIVRHAKSSWDSPQLEDYERPVIPKGFKRTERIIKFLQESGVKVDLLYASHAVRAAETARMLGPALGVEVDQIITEPEIYHGGTNALSNLIYGLPNDVSSVMIVGHNPVVSDFANEYADQHIDWLPTSAVVALRFETDAWEKIDQAKVETVFVVTPSMLKN
ncbi:MAG TPA: histidine phosphatase family protein [Bacteroidales bacterium]|nr:histidine phosphatase family protein [Bacteroidales bacterium]